MDSDKTILLKQVRLVAMDVDGVLTDGTLGYDDEGREQKRFHVADGLGIALLRWAGIPVAWISGRKSATVARRASELHVAYLFQGVSDKGAVLVRLMDELSLPRSSVVYIGDDLNDVLAFNAVGVRVAVSNAEESLRIAADLVTDRAGGHGAVRDLCNAILTAQGRTKDVHDLYLTSLKDHSPDGASNQ